MSDRTVSPQITFPTFFLSNVAFFLGKQICFVKIDESTGEATGFGAGAGTGRPGVPTGHRTAPGFFGGWSRPGRTTPGFFGG